MQAREASTAKSSGVHPATRGGKSYSFPALPHFLPQLLPHSLPHSLPQSDKRLSGVPDQTPTVPSMAGGLNEPSIIAKLWHHVQRSGYFDRKGLLGRYTV